MAPDTPMPQAERRKKAFELLSERAPITRDALEDAKIGQKSANSLQAFLLEHEAVTVTADGSWEISSRIGRLLVFSVTREILRGAIIDGHGRIVRETGRGIALSPRKGKRMSPVNFERRITALAASLLEKEDPDVAPVVGCVVAWPAPISRTTGEPIRFEGASWRRVALRKLFADALAEPLKRRNLDVIIVNDADADALGEAHWGVARDRKVVLLVKVSGGVGTSIVVGGHVFHGAFGEAGEIGHMPIAEADRLDLRSVRCSCQAKDHLECFASGKAIVDNIYTPERAGQYNELMVEAAERKDEIPVRQVLEKVGTVLGTALIPVAMLTDPDIIVLSSVLWDKGLLESVKTALRRGSAFKVDDREIVLGSAPDEANKMMLYGAGEVARQHFVLPTLKSILRLDD